MQYTVNRLILLEYMLALYIFLLVILYLAIIISISAHTQSVKCQTYSGITDHCWRSSILCCYLVIHWRRPAPPWAQNRRARLYSFSNIYLLFPTQHKRQVTCVWFAPGRVFSLIHCAWSGSVKNYSTMYKRSTGRIISFQKKYYQLPDSIWYFSIVYRN